MHHHIGASRQWTLQRWCAKAIINRKQSARVVRNVRNFSDIANLTQGVRGCLTEEQFGSRSDGLLPFIQLTKCDERNRYI
jgi:hypothetical protein